MLVDGLVELATCSNHTQTNDALIGNAVDTFIRLLKLQSDVYHLGFIVYSYNADRLIFSPR